MNFLKLGNITYFLLNLRMLCTFWSAFVSFGNISHKLLEIMHLPLSYQNVKQWNTKLSMCAHQQNLWEVM